MALLNLFASILLWLFMKLCIIPACRQVTDITNPFLPASPHSPPCITTLQSLPVFMPRRLPSRERRIVVTERQWCWPPGWNTEASVSPLPLWKPSFHTRPTVSAAMWHPLTLKTQKAMGKNIETKNVNTPITCGSEKWNPALSIFFSRCHHR